MKLHELITRMRVGVLKEGEPECDILYRHCTYWLFRVLRQLNFYIDAEKCAD